MKVFVIGCGRSGTHWLGRGIGSHPDFVALIEQQPMFGMVQQMAWDASLIPTHIDALVALYRSTHDEVRPRHLADKSHSNLWLADELDARLPDAWFVAIRRKLFGTVASMLRHDGVLRHFKTWDDAPRQNRFLGVEDVAAYRRLSLEERCAHRVIGSWREIDGLQSASSVKLHVIEYGSLLADSVAEASRLAQFLGVKDAFTFAAAAPDQGEKWRATLSDEQIDCIASFAASNNATHLLEQR
ncbi:MAG: sulfotransferase [Terricaulis sp.]